MKRLAAALLFAAMVWLPAAPAAADSGLPIPRFVSLKADKVNVRAGPGRRYPIDWVFLRKSMPVEVVAEFDTWRKIRDFEGTEGWVHQSLLSGRRGALLTGDVVHELRAQPHGDALVVARAESGVVGALLSCPAGDDHDAIGWCQIDVAGHRGWLPRRELWGLYADEAVE
ncbi:MAG: SH3 domain-containing protein [Inquilinus sp.]|nr:SH3 domain-containing protein [Inquilinus sp.]